MAISGTTQLKMLFFRRITNPRLAMASDVLALGQLYNDASHHWRQKPMPLIILLSLMQAELRISVLLHHPPYVANHGNFYHPTAVLRRVSLQVLPRLIWQVGGGRIASFQAKQSACFTH